MAPLRFSSAETNSSRSRPCNDRGASAVEFALIAPVVLMVFLAAVDLGFREYVGTQLQGTMDQAARKVTVGGVSSSTITSFVTNRIKSILPGASVTITTKSYDDFSDVGKPEPITTDTAPLGSYNTGDCFEDMNGNGVWDSDSGSSGFGTSDDIVYYTATVSYPALVPVGKLLGWSTTETVKATTMMRNQPFAAQAQPVVKCT